MDDVSMQTPGMLLTWQESDNELYHLTPVPRNTFVTLAGRQYRVLRQGPLQPDGTAMVLVRYTAYPPKLTRLEVTW